MERPLAERPVPLGALALHRAAGMEIRALAAGEHALVPLDETCERAINHDGSPQMAARLLSHDLQIVRAAEGTGLSSAAAFVHLASAAAAAKKFAMLAWAAAASGRSPAS